VSRVLSVVIPAYNEERFIGALLEKVIAVDLSMFDTTKQIIVVDDHSRDRTAEIARGYPAVSVTSLARNGGKGKAVRAGLDQATGDYVIIQDADLEYDPNDYVPMMAALVSGEADAVYGSRYMTDASRGRRGIVSAKDRNQSWAAYLGGRSISIAALFCTGVWLTESGSPTPLLRSNYSGATSLSRWRSRQRVSSWTTKSRPKSSRRASESAKCPSATSRAAKRKERRLV
jgi:dolichol-phosphate mannosyltransferase